MNIRKLHLPVFFICLASVSAAHGQGNDFPVMAKDVVAKCESALQLDPAEWPIDRRLIDAANFGYCYAYLQAVVDMANLRSEKVYCIPIGTTPKEVVQAFVKRARNDSIFPNQERAFGVDVLLQGAFPCPNPWDEK
jgi:hypothetical protein